MFRAMPVRGSVAVRTWVPGARWMNGSGEAGSIRRVGELQRAVPGRLVTGRSLLVPEGISGSSRKVMPWVGVMIFSGSLYVMVLTQERWLGAITPIGGVLMLVGWGLLLVRPAR